MEFYAAKCPGKYFVFNCSEHIIADTIDTSPPISGHLGPGSIRKIEESETRQVLASRRI
jgi:hypothetical protein